MTRWIIVRSYPQGPRVWLCGQRLHHGATGLALLATGRPWAIAAGLLLCAHDRRDWKVWLVRERTPALDELSAAP